MSYILLLIKRNIATVVMVWSCVMLCAVIGCKVLRAPPGGWVRIESKSKTVVGCNSTDEQWHLTCSGTQWNGPPIGNCSAAMATG